MVICNHHDGNNTSYMVKFKTTLSFGFNLERKPQVPKEEKTISKVFMVFKEVIKKHWQKS